jgi:hypothetical protein
MDSNAFIQFLAEWHDFFIVAGTAAATLVGLLFVGLSVNVDEVMARDRPDLRALAEQAFASFTYVLLISLFFLVPRIDPSNIAVELATLGVLGLWRILVRIRRGFRYADRRSWGRSWMARRLGLPAIAYLGLGVVALGIALLQPDAMSILVAVLFVLLTTAADSAWDLLVRVSDDKRRRATDLAAPTPAGPTLPPAPAASQEVAASDANGPPRHDVEAPAEPEIRRRPEQVDPAGG